MLQIEIKHLELIQTISKTENLTRAANLLNISQPALSRRLLDIENRLGTHLFHRSKKRMILTPEGARMLKSARTILEELETAELDISKIVNGETGNLCVGVSCLYCFQWLPAVITDFQKQYPKVDLTINSSQDHYQDLKEKGFNLVITAKPVNGEEYSIVNLFEDEMIIITAPNHPLSAKRFITHHDMAKYKMITTKRMVRQLINRGLLPDDIDESENFMYIEHPNAIIELVKAGLGISLAPRWAVRSYLDSGMLTAAPIGEEGIHPVWKVIYLKQKQLSPFQQKFIDVMTKQQLP